MSRCYDHAGSREARGIKPMIRTSRRASGAIGVRGYIARKVKYALVALGLFASAAPGAQKDIAPPVVAGTTNTYFGIFVTALSTGNFVVLDPLATVNGVSQAGAVYLYKPDGTLISTLTGSHASDEVGYNAGGSASVVEVGNGNFVVVSTNWSSDPVTASQVGAVTWVNGTTGLNAAVSSGNSLVGSTTNDHVGIGDPSLTPGIFVLSNGNYVVSSPYWNNGGTAGQAGAATWGSGASGITGTISESNSFVGLAANDAVGAAIVPLKNNGNYLVISPIWSSKQGAVTWGNGATGLKGHITVTNSLYGASANDEVGYGFATALANGNYVVLSPLWHGNFGAATWGNGATGTPTGSVGIENSLIGGNSGDKVGSNGVTAFPSGNVVVSSPFWNDPANGSVGAATWINGATGMPTGFILESNSLIGATSGDAVSDGGVTLLSNGSYVVLSTAWSYNEFAPGVGAATLCDSDGACVGKVTPEKSLSAYDKFDMDFGKVIALPNAKYLVNMPNWTDQTRSVANVGAVAWCDALTNSCANVLVNPNDALHPFLTGYSANDLVGSSAGKNGVIGLPNGSYVVGSSNWTDAFDNIAHVGAVTWCSALACSGPVTAGGSLVGSTSYDQVGYDVLALANGNYLVESPNWNGNSGAVTLLNGTRGYSGVVSSVNSFVGANAGDSVGSQIAIMSDGNYVVVSNGYGAGAGAVTLASGQSRLIGSIAPWNSVIQQSTLGAIKYAYDPSRHQLIVGRPGDNLVSLFTMDQVFFDNYEN